jgi:phage head maturation protease
MKKSIDELMAEYAKRWNGFRIDGKGHLVLVKSDLKEHRLATKPADFSIKQFDEKSKLFLAGVANAKEVDRMTEVLEPTGLIDAPFRKNPVLLRQHCHDWPIGNVTSLKPENDGVKFEAWCGDPAAAPLTPMQVETRSLIAQRILRAVSVGFIPQKIRMPAYNDAGDIVDPAVIESWELLELSVVAVPCNASSIFDIKGIKNLEQQSVRSLELAKTRFKTRAAAIAWLKEHGFATDRIDETEHTYTIAQALEKDFSIDTLQTVDVENGIRAILGKRKNAIGFPQLGGDGKFILIPNERAAKMDEVKDLLKALSASMNDLAKGINSIADGQKSLLTGIETLAKGKKPDDSMDDDEDDKKGLKARIAKLETDLKTQGETLAELVDVAKAHSDTLKAIVEKH